MNAENHFGRLVRHTRIQHGLDRDELARRAHCSVETVKKIESGRRRPSRAMAESLARGLGLSQSATRGFLEVAFISEKTPDSAGLHNLPYPLTPLVGREEDIHAVSNILLNDESRLVTLVGAPGVGKTRLALGVAHKLIHRFVEGARFVSLGSVAAAEDIPAALLIELNLTAHTTSNPLEQLVRGLAHRQMLLVLDNFEHLHEGAPLISHLLQYCPLVSVLTTSRVALELYGEHLYTVHPLPPPEPTIWSSPSELESLAAMQLFLARIRAAKSDFRLNSENAPFLAELCVRLDGIPLALELTAARMGEYAPSILLAEFRRRDGGRLALLAGTARDVPLRQRTLRQAIDYSFTRLSAHEQQVFTRLAVMNCPFDAATAWAVAGEDAEVSPESEIGETMLPTGEFIAALENLAAHHLLQRSSGQGGQRESTTTALTGMRYTYLETLRDFALERLAAGGHAYEARRRHAWFHAILARGLDPIPTGGDLEHVRHEIRVRYADFYAAWQWAIAQGTNEVHVAYELAAGLSHLWYLEAMWPQGAQALGSTLAIPIPDSPAQDGYLRKLRARMATGLGVLLVGIGDYAAALSNFEMGLALASEAGDELIAAWTHAQMAHRAELIGDFEGCVTHANTALALFRTLNAEAYVGLLLERLAIAAVESGEYDDAAENLNEAEIIFRRLGHASGLATVGNMRGMVHLARGQADMAQACFAESYRVFDVAQQVHGVAWTLRNLALASTLAGDTVAAAGYLARALEFYREMGSQDAMIMLVEAFGGVAARDGAREPAAILWAAANAGRQEMNIPRSANVTEVFCRILGDESVLLSCHASPQQGVGLDEALTLALCHFAQGEAHVKPDQATAPGLG